MSMKRIPTPEKRIARIQWNSVVRRAPAIGVAATSHEYMPASIRATPHTKQPQEASNAKEKAEACANFIHILR